MIGRRTASNALRAVFAGLLVGAVATGFVVFGSGLPVVVGFDGVVLAAGASLLLGSAAAGSVTYALLGRESSAVDSAAREGAIAPTRKDP